MDVQPLAAAHVVVAAVPPAGHLITDDPALLRLPSGRLLATFTFRGTRGPNVTQQPAAVPARAQRRMKDARGSS